MKLAFYLEKSSSLFPDYQYFSRSEWSSKASHSRSDCWLCAELETAIRKYGVYAPKSWEFKTWTTVRSLDTPRRAKGLCFIVEPGPQSERATFFISNDAGVPLPSATQISPPTHKPSFDPQKVDYFSIRAWLDHCRERHHCGEYLKPSTSHLRLIDCTTRRISILSARDYIALSYLWGPGMADVQSLEEELPDTVPLVVEDAMTVAIKLGIPYLWIDRYCIDQNNDTEKHHIINNMDKIYSGAALTIVAAAGPDPHFGLPGVCKRSRKFPHTLKIGRHRLIGLISPKDLIVHSRWYTRGWTYQEMLLSRRRLVFTVDQVYFQCHEMICLEKFDRRVFPLRPEVYDSPLLAFPANGIGDTILHLYTRLEEYSSRSLSVSSDALRAFEGIFNAFRQPQYHTKYESGEPTVSHFWGIPIWTPTKGWGDRLKCISFALGLAWQVQDSEQSNFPLPQDNEIRWPTWSWARFHGRRLRFHLDQELEEIRDVEEISVKFTRHSGELVDVAEYDSEHDDYTDFQSWIDITSWTISGHMQCSESQYLVFGPNKAILDNNDTPSGPVIAVHLGTCRSTTSPDIFNMAKFLLLASAEPGNFRRIGIFEYKILKKQTFDHGSTDTTVCPWGSSPRLDALQCKWEYRTLRII
ncbi:heterokaryon incompatibility protein-domain-containing protein [Lophiotrema nucula]|uniref:Heterokaryon incompatibility protein-domain-containing protein n=1 Tax=Lophiotrema nucula TaxID=690887 RepID=A0A6A5Z8V9_9PLEO|nr:heterokaryon incompatibility protein-domain-containing protein [Lophiotrema nucula]